MSDGSSLRQSWSKALSDAEGRFRQLLTASPGDWKRINHTLDSSSGKKGKTRASAIPELTDVTVHRYLNKAGQDVYRLVLDIPTGDEPVSLESWRAVLTTPELRREWDPAVEEAHLLEILDHTTRISKTNFTLGWPANPRDSVTISRSFPDPNAVIDITTSLPRSPDEPAYLRPSPPYVRSHVSLFAWFIQHIQSPSSVPNDRTRKNSPFAKIRITCFWQHDLKFLWNFSPSAALTQQLSTMMLGLHKTVLKSGTHVPKLTGYGNGVSIERIRFQIDREALTVEYGIVPEDEEHPLMQGIEGVHALRELQRLTRSIECVLPSSEGWDIRVTIKGSSDEVQQLPWTTHAIRTSTSPSLPADQIRFRLSHAALIDGNSVLKVTVVIERSGPTNGLRLNGIPQSVQEVEERDPTIQFISEHVFQDVSSAVDLSFATTSSLGTMQTEASISSAIRSTTERTTAAEKTILSKVRRNYIYFSSLLQEPEAKWRRTSEGRGVSITQLDSIDPTLVVYRAEATFVGVGLWDLYAAVATPGARIFWDKQHEDAVLLEDVNELSELWHYKTRPAWPVNGRDAVVLKTIYKSPTTIHVFAFSADESYLFPNIPPADPNYIRTQVDLQGFSIEALSPNTTLLTMLEQSDPKGWGGKTSIPAQMISSLAGIGDFAIKCGGPPVVTRLSAAKANEMRYDHERLSFRFEYEASASRTNVSPSTTDSGDDQEILSSSPMIECEVRCDMDTWAPSLDIVVDPPPQTISCLRRHRLSTEGGGLWLTIMHDTMFVDDDRLQVIVRRAPGKERGLVMVNGAKMAVDAEELSESEVKALAKQKRVKPPRIPLDQPPVEGIIKRRKAEWDAATLEDKDGGAVKEGVSVGDSGTWASAPKIPNPLTRWFNSAMESATVTTQQAVAAISPAGASGSTVVPSPSKMPMQYALEALAWMQDSHSHFFSSTGWDPVGGAGDKGLPVFKKLAPEICPVIPVHKGSKVIEGVSAEELAVAVTELECRKRWDDRLDSVQVLESFGGEAKTSFVVTRTGFPWRDRGFYVASVVARAISPPSASRRTSSTGEVAEQSNAVKNAIFCVSASFSPDSVARFSSAKYNSYALPVGRVYIDAWVLETLDPYTKENYAIPSTRCTRLVAVDFAGSIPAAVNSMINAALPRAVLAVEAFVKGFISHPLTRLPTPALVITDKKTEENLATVAWKLRKRDENRLLVDGRYNAEERLYTSAILVKVQKDPSATSRSPSKPAVDSPGDQTTPRPSKIILGNSPSSHFAEPSVSEVPESQMHDSVLTASLSGSGHSLPYPYFSPSVTSSLRHRSASASVPSIASVAPGSYIRGRTTSSAFTFRGEVRPTTDLIVAELVVESKLYPEGYDVTLRSKPRSVLRPGGKEGFIPLRTILMPSPIQETAQSSPEVGKDGDFALPLACTIHTMPSSPLHSSGLHEGESPTRHLLRLTLPTAQYQISTVRDPLTGEMQGPPPAPLWLREMREGGVVALIEIRPRKDDSNPSASIRKRVKVRVNGNDVKVVGEKEALTTLGRDELLDDRVSKMGVLSRVPIEAEPLPDELKIPVAIAEDLLDSSSPASEDRSSTEMSEDNELTRISDQGGDKPSDQSPSLVSTPHVPQVAANGLLGFWNSYNNPIARLANGTTTVTNDTKSKTNMSITNLNSTKGAKGDGPQSNTPLPVTRRLGGNTETAAPSPTNCANHEGRSYPLSTVLVVAVIAFLIGSLLRSLLSPADFIYVVTNLKDVEEGHVEKGWREIRRLVEIKYLVGGWDFQVAVVRRH